MENEDLQAYERLKQRLTSSGKLSSKPVDSSEFGKIDPLSPAAPKANPLQMFLVDLLELTEYSQLTIDEKVACFAWMSGMAMAKSSSLDEYNRLMQTFDVNFTDTIRQHLRMHFV